MDRPKNSQLQAFLRQVRKSYFDYGGSGAILKSPFFILAIVLTTTSYKLWGGDDWTGLILQVVPNMLGFTLGAFAILVGMMSAPIKNALANVKNSRGVAYLDEVSSTFLHFIFVQIISIIFSILYRQTVVTDIHNYLMDTSYCKIDFMPFLKVLGSICGVMLFFYSILLAVPASLAIVRIARIREPN